MKISHLNPLSFIFHDTFDQLNNHKIPIYNCENSHLIFIDNRTYFILQLIDKSGPIEEHDLFQKYTELNKKENCTNTPLDYTEFHKLLEYLKINNIIV